MEVLHHDQLLEHGGRPGLRDENALEAALARPRNRWHYKPDTNLAALATGYAVGLARDHPFVDGNRRIALVAMGAFMDVNGLDLTAGDDEVVGLMLAVADGSMAEYALANWIREHTTKRR